MSQWVTVSDRSSDWLAARWGEQRLEHFLLHHLLHFPIKGQIGGQTLTRISICWSTSSLDTNSRSKANLLGKLMTTSNLFSALIHHKHGKEASWIIWSMNYCNPPWTQDSREKKKSREFPHLVFKQYECDCLQWYLFKKLPDCQRWIPKPTSLKEVSVSKANQDIPCGLLQGNPDTRHVAGYPWVPSKV